MKVNSSRKSGEYEGEEKYNTTPLIRTKWDGEPSGYGRRRKKKKVNLIFL
jgi:hypothetical protein